MHRFFVTVDVDWAPDWACDALATALVDAGVASTWFMTHRSPVLEDLRSESSIELGIHPNFLPGSSHGSTPLEVFETCLDFVPEAHVMRGHCLMQSTPIFQTAIDATPIRLDSSIYLKDLRQVAVSPLHLRGGVMNRVPFVWEDDVEFQNPTPEWDAVELVAARDADDEITIVNLHPIHVALNSADPGPYGLLRALQPDTRAATAAQVDEVRERRLPGAADFVRSIATLAADPRMLTSETLSSLVSVRV